MQLQHGEPRLPAPRRQVQQQVPLQEPQLAALAGVQQPAAQGDDVLLAGLPQRGVSRPSHPTRQDCEAEGRRD